MTNKKPMILHKEGYPNTSYIYKGPYPEDYVGKVWRTMNGTWTAWKIDDPNKYYKDKLGNNRLKAQISWGNWHKEDAIQFLMEKVNVIND